MRNRFLSVLMRWLGRALVLLGILVGTAGCGHSEKSSPEATSTAADTASSAPTGEKPSDYHFQLKYEDMWGVTTLTVNGFPVHQSGGGHITDNPVLSIGLNTGLVGSENRVSVEVEPMILGGKEISIGPVEVHGRVTRDYEGEFEVEGATITEAQVDSVYEAWSERAKTRWKKYRSRIEQGALDSMRAWAERNPLTVSTTFDNEAGPDFSRIFEEAPVLEDTPATRERLVGYAMRLGSLFAEEKVEALYREHRLTFEENDSSKERALRLIEDNWLRYNWHTDFTREDLALRQWSDGRIWEIYRDDEVSDRLSKQALFLAGEDRLVGAHKVYVAQIDGELKVVR